MYRQTNEMQEYGKLTEQTNRKLTLCSGVPCQGLTGSILVVLLTPNYSISSTGLFRANTRDGLYPALLSTRSQHASEARTVHDAEETRSSLTYFTGDCCAGEPVSL
jgi:hypothetical protein